MSPGCACAVAATSNKTSDGRSVNVIVNVIVNEKRHALGVALITAERERSDARLRRLRRLLRRCRGLAVRLCPVAIRGRVLLELGNARGLLPRELRLFAAEVAVRRRLPEDR